MLIKFDTKDTNRKIEKEIEILGKECKDIKEQNAAIKKSIELACNDFMARTETVNNKQTLQLSDLLLTDDFEKKNLGSILNDFFSKQYNSQKSFNSWHHETCKWILKRIHEKYPNAAYGKAQKILNMTFKYLYCTKYGQEKRKGTENPFKYCHMALDSYTLEWVYRDVYSRYNEEKKRNEKLTREKTPKWSNLNAPEKLPENSDNQMHLDKNGKYDYPSITQLIFDYFEKDWGIKKDNNDIAISPFEAEFIIWREIQLHMAAEEFIFAYNKKLSTSDKMEYKKEDLISKLEDVKSLIVDYELSSPVQYINPKLCKTKNIHIELRQNNIDTLPHLHVYVDKNRNPEKSVYIRLDKPEYIPQFESVTLSLEQKNEFIEIMKTTWENHYIKSNISNEIKQASGFEASVDIWTNTFGKSKEIKYDEKGFPVMPDYTQL